MWQIRKIEKMDCFLFLMAQSNNILVPIPKASFEEKLPPNEINVDPPLISIMMTRSYGKEMDVLSATYAGRGSKHFGKRKSTCDDYNEQKTFK